MAAARLAIQTHFRNIPDPRRCPRHLLIDIIVIAVCAVICGANDWQQIVTFGQRRRSWLQRFLALPHGIPCPDTFERVFERLDPRRFATAFQRWMRAQFTWERKQLECNFEVYIFRLHAAQQRRVLWLLFIVGSSALDVWAEPTDFEEDWLIRLGTITQRFFGLGSVRK